MELDFEWEVKTQGKRWKQKIDRQYFEAKNIPVISVAWICAQYFLSKLNLIDCHRKPHFYCSFFHLYFLNEKTTNLN